MTGSRTIGGTVPKLSIEIWNMKLSFNNRKNIGFGYTMLRGKGVLEQHGVFV